MFITSRRSPIPFAIIPRVSTTVLPRPLRGFFPSVSRLPGLLCSGHFLCTDSYTSGSFVAGCFQHFESLPPSGPPRLLRQTTAGNGGEGAGSFQASEPGPPSSTSSLSSCSEAVVGPWPRGARLDTCDASMVTCLPRRRGRENAELSQPEPPSAGPRITR